MEASASPKPDLQRPHFAGFAPVRVRLPDLPSIGEEELSQSVARGFVEALHCSRERADQVVARGIEEEASFAARELLVNGVLGGREGVELPLALLGALYRFLGCDVSAWSETPSRGLLRIWDCPVRRALALTGMACPGLCQRMREGALSALEEPVSAARSPGDPGCLIAVRLEAGGRRARRFPKQSM